MRDFKVIEGGLAEKPNKKKHHVFLSGWVSDTRLMGVVTMGLHYLTERGDLFMLFYYDVEEYAFDRFEWSDGTDPTFFREMEASMIGGLGGKKVEIDDDEACHLLKVFIQQNQLKSYPLPGETAVYRFMMGRGNPLNKARRDALFAKTCTTLTSDTELINYFLMRVCGQDFSAAAWLTDGSFDPNIFPELGYLTFSRNMVEKQDDGSYTCRSIVFDGSGYYLVLTEIHVEYMTVTSAKKISAMPLSDMEAYMNLARPEFVTVYECDEDMRLDRPATDLTGRGMILNEHGGVSVMLYKQDNAHVAEADYRLYNDLLGVYHMTASWQLIAAAYRKEDIEKLEEDIRLNLGDGARVTAKLEFNEPVVVQFLDSEYEDFLEFVEAASIE